MVAVFHKTWKYFSLGYKMTAVYLTAKHLEPTKWQVWTKCFAYTLLAVVNIKQYRRALIRCNIAEQYGSQPQVMCGKTRLILLSSTLKGHCDMLVCLKMYINFKIFPGICYFLATTESYQVFATRASKLHYPLHISTINSSQLYILITI